MRPWRVGILGAGRIAQGFDEPGADRVLSLAHAFSRSSRFEVGGFFDLDPARAVEAERRWGVPASPRDRAQWLSAGWDAIYIATPDAQHAADLRDAVAAGVRALLVEKPVAARPAEGLALLEAAQTAGVPVVVNYPRRWHSAIARLREMADTGSLSAPVHVGAVVSGAGGHNLPHIVDVLHAIWGGGWTITGNGGTPRTSLMTWQKDAAAFSLTWTVIDGPDYVWELHCYCRPGKLELSRSPEVAEWFAPAPHPSYTDFQVLTPVWRAGMEDESLLERSVSALADALESPAAGRRATEREIECQRLVVAAMSWLHPE